MWEYLVKKIRSPRIPHPKNSPEHISQVSREPVITEPVHDASETPQKKVRHQSVRGDRSRIIQCPVCHLDMDRVYIHEVQVDECPGCGGLFLDRGELATIAGLDPVIWLKAADQEDDSDGLNLYSPDGLRNKRNR